MHFKPFHFPSHPLLGCEKIISRQNLAQNTWIPYFLPDVKIKENKFIFFPPIKGLNKVWVKFCPCFDKWFSFTKVLTSSDLKKKKKDKKMKRGVGRRGIGGSASLMVITWNCCFQRMPNHLSFSVIWEEHLLFAVQYHQKTAIISTWPPLRWLWSQAVVGCWSVSKYFRVLNSDQEPCSASE